VTSFRAGARPEAIGSRLAHPWQGVLVITTERDLVKAVRPDDAAILAK